MTPVSVLVTGATGFVGGHVVRVLVESGAEVRALVRPDAAPEKVMRFQELYPDVRVARGDLLDERSLAEAVRGADQLVHCAARMGYWSRFNALQHRVNVDGTVNLLRQARKKRLSKIVHVSSIATIGCNRNGELLTEETPWTGQRRPRIYYVATKREAEERALAAASAGAPVTVVNPSMMLGAHLLQDREKGFQASARSGVTRVPRGGPSVAHVKDVARGILAALERGRVGERYILAGANCSWLELHTAIAQRSGAAPPRGEYSPLRGMALERATTLLDHLHLSRPRWAPERWRAWGWYSHASCMKAERELGYQPPALPDVLDQLAPSESPA